MYLWKYKKLADALKAQSITTRQRSIYTGVFCIAMGLWAFDISNRAALGYFDSLTPDLFFIAVWLGFTWFFNSKGDNKEYLDRLICLYTPIILRVMLFALVGVTMVSLSAWAGMSMMSITSQEEADRVKAVYTMLIMTVPIGLCVYFIIAFIKGFRIASGQEQPAG